MSQASTQKNQARFKGAAMPLKISDQADSICHMGGVFYYHMIGGIRKTSY
jgi:hypothetical protein